MPEILDFYWVGCIGKVILQVSLAFFSGTVKKFFGQRWLSRVEKIGPYAYVYSGWVVSCHFSFSLEIVLLLIAHTSFVIITFVTVVLYLAKGCLICWRFCLLYPFTYNVVESVSFDFWFTAFGSLFILQQVFNFFDCNSVFSLLYTLVVGYI